MLSRFLAVAGLVALASAAPRPHDDHWVESQDSNGYGYGGGCGTSCNAGCWAGGSCHTAEGGATESACAGNAGKWCSPCKNQAPYSSGGYGRRLLTTGYGSTSSSGTCVGCYASGACHTPGQEQQCKVNRGIWCPAPPPPAPIAHTGGGYTTSSDSASDWASSISPFVGTGFNLFNPANSLFTGTVSRQAGSPIFQNLASNLQCFKKSNCVSFSGVKVTSFNDTSTWASQMASWLNFSIALNVSIPMDSEPPAPSGAGSVPTIQVEASFTHTSTHKSTHHNFSNHNGYAINHASTGQYCYTLGSNPGCPGLTAGVSAVNPQLWRDLYSIEVQLTGDEPATCVQSNANQYTAQAPVYQGGVWTTEPQSFTGYDCTVPEMSQNSASSWYNFFETWGSHVTSGVQTGAWIRGIAAMNSSCSSSSDSVEHSNAGNLGLALSGGSGPSGAFHFGISEGYEHASASTQCQDETNIQCNAGGGSDNIARGGACPQTVPGPAKGTPEFTTQVNNMGNFLQSAEACEGNGGAASCISKLNFHGELTSMMKSWIGADVIGLENGLMPVLIPMGLTAEQCGPAATQQQATFGTRIPCTASFFMGTANQNSGCYFPAGNGVGYECFYAPELSQKMYKRLTQAHNYFNSATSADLEAMNLGIQWTSPGSRR